MPDGILIIDKPPGMTSHDVVDEVRRLVGMRKVGHAGTLDPMATGVLVLCLGQATKVVKYLMDSDKVYEAHIRLGVTTDTHDAQGKIVSTSEVDITESEVREALSSFVGQIQQVPPLYSALKYHGTPLYKLARRGIKVELKPRSVQIYEIELLDWAPPCLTIKVVCSAGTYIRALARDLGERLGCGAHLAHLIRLASGRFTLREAVSLEELTRAFERGNWRKLLRPLDDALVDLPAMVVNEEVEKRIRQGQQVEGEGPPGLCRAYSTDGRLVAILKYDQRTGLWQPKRVFQTSHHPSQVAVQ